MKNEIEDFYNLGEEKKERYFKRAVIINLILVGFLLALTIIL
jgi:hypothetical protein